VIDIKKTQCFDAVAIANSGQVFRSNVTPKGVEFISGAEYALVRGDDIIETTNDAYFRNYFDLSTDYEKMPLKLPEIVKKSCCGLRILNGDIIEIIISFIISANNNIKRIRATINRLCEKYGKNCGNYFAFPTLDKLSKITETDFSKLGCGYRSPYLVKTIKILTTINLSNWQKLSNDELYNQLIALSGVGDKVARCIMLFAFHRLDIIPVDTWIIKNADKFIKNPAKSPKSVALQLQSHFGRFGGVAQQYIFYYTQFLRRELP